MTALANLWALLLAFTITACGGSSFSLPLSPSPEVPKREAVIRLVVDRSIYGGALLQIGDSSLWARPGQRSDCLTWKGLSGTHLVTVKGRTGKASYLWTVSDERLNMWVNVREYDGEVEAIWTWISKEQADEYCETFHMPPLHGLSQPNFTTETSNVVR